jgi:hypothetical protein
MNDQGYDFNEAFFARQQTNRNYAGPLDMPWLSTGMAMAQWNSGTISSPLEPDEVTMKFYHPSILANKSYPDLLCIWRIKAIKTSEI